jgi:hypothetical protein
VYQDYGLSALCWISNGLVSQEFQQLQYGGRYADQPEKPQTPAQPGNASNFTYCILPIDYVHQ